MNWWIINNDVVASICFVVCWQFIAMAVVLMVMAVQSADGAPQLGHLLSHLIGGGHGHGHGGGYGGNDQNSWNHQQLNIDECWCSIVIISSGGHGGYGGGYNNYGGYGGGNTNRLSL